MSPAPGAFAVLCALIVVVALICIVWEKWRDAKLDRDIRRAFKEAERLGLIGRDAK